MAIEFPKTFKRKIPVYEGAVFLREWLESHPERLNPDAPVFPLSYEAVRKFLLRLGEKAIGKHINPHLLRHSFATWLASKKVGRYQMCKVMGWAMSSDMPDQYIDRVGVVEQDTLSSIRHDELSRVEQENLQLKQTLHRLDGQFQELQEVSAKARDRDDLLNSLFKDRDVADFLAKKIRENGLGKKLAAL